MTEPQSTFTLRTVADDPSLESQLEQLIEEVWPAAILKSTTPPAFDTRTDWYGIYSRWPHLQFGLFDKNENELVAAGNMLCFAWDDDATALPDRGWTWAMQQAVKDFEDKRKPVTAVGLSVSIAPAWRGKGISRHALKTMHRLVHQHHLERLIVPVRPSLKARYPLIPMTEYAFWKNEAGLPFDPWIRTHVRLGAEIVAICDESMCFGGTVEEWELWTELTLQSSGDYVVPTLLTPLHVDRKKNLGISIEPNVWMEHPISTA